MAAAFPPEHVHRRPAEWGGPKPHVDLRGFLTAQLLAAGLGDVSNSGELGCTVEGAAAGRTFSHRGDAGVGHGRMLGFVGLRAL